MTMRFRAVERLAEFDRDLRKLKRRYRTLEEDLETLVNVAVAAYHKLALDSGIVEIGGLGQTRLPVYKARKFACRSLPSKGARTGLRLIYSYDEKCDTVELIEIYIKSDKENEDRKRILDNYGTGKEKKGK